jgi:hypothetical protein
VIGRNLTLPERWSLSSSPWDLSTPDSVQKLQAALHAKAKAEPGYRFYALYDKISREDILAHAYAQCRRSNRGAPGVDRQDPEAVEAYGVERWLGELALALRQETYRPDPMRRVYIPKANGKLRPLGISTLRDRVCMTAAMLVLEPIFEADLPSELYAYRPRRNAQRARHRLDFYPVRHPGQRRRRNPNPVCCGCCPSRDGTLLYKRFSSPVGVRSHIRPAFPAVASRAGNSKRSATPFRSRSPCGIMPVVA